MTVKKALTSSSKYYESISLSRKDLVMQSNGLANLHGRVLKHLKDLEASDPSTPSFNKYEKERLLLEVKQWQLRADYYRLRIENKLYVDRLGKVFNGFGVPFTISQILDDEMAIMYQHIKNAQELIDSL